MLFLFTRWTDPNYVTFLECVFVIRCPTSLYFYDRFRAKILLYSYTAIDRFFASSRVALLQVSETFVHAASSRHQGHPSERPFRGLEWQHGGVRWGGLPAEDLWPGRPRPLMLRHFFNERSWQRLRTCLWQHIALIQQDFIEARERRGKRKARW